MSGALPDGKSCYVYIIAHVSPPMLVGPVKVGISANPFSRVFEIQTGNPVELQVAAWFAMPTREIALAIERAFHTVMAEHGLKGEWFNLSVLHAISALCSAVRAHLEALGLDGDDLAAALEKASVTQHENYAAAGAKLQ